MTIVCFDGRFVAADTAVWHNDTQAHWPVRKLAAKGGRVYALAGTGNLFEPMVSWFDAGCPADARPTAHEEDSASSLIVFDPRRQLVAQRIALRTPYPEELRAPWAWGAEFDFAMGCMQFGASPMDAVEAAIRRGSCAGGFVDFVDLHDPDLEIRRWPDDHTAPAIPNLAIVPG